MTVQFKRAIPVFRIYSMEKAREFYLDFLGFQLDWEHRFIPDAPVYMQVSRGGLAIRLNEHPWRRHARLGRLCHHDGVKDLHRELNDKNYGHNHPGLDQQDWGMIEMTVTDPFNNRITFAEPSDPSPA